MTKFKCVLLGLLLCVTASAAPMLGIERGYDSTGQVVLSLVAINLDPSATYILFYCFEGGNLTDNWLEIRANQLLYYPSQDGPMRRTV